MTRTTRSLLTALLVAASLPLAVAAQDEAATPAVRTVELPSAGSPLVAVRLQFEVGSVDDPAGKEGLAALTAQMLASAGTAERSYAELVDALYPMAASIDVNTDRELTVISGLVHVDTLADYTALLTEAVLHPGFAENDFERNRAQLEAYLTNTLRAANDELLGLETLQQVIFAGHPYEHSPAGTVAGLGAITLDDVKSFYASHFTPDRLTVGVAGGYPDGYGASLAAKLAALPAGPSAPRPVIPAPAAPEGRSFTLVDKATDSVGIHFGFPLPLTRADADYYPLMVANSYLGEHRTFHGRLMQQLRGERGLNYGDYSYIEYWEAPPFTSAPSPGVARHRQYFSVWIRPVQPPTAHFALRAGLSEVDRLIEKGLTEDEFQLTRSFLVNYSKLWAQTLPDRLGFLMDSEYLGMPYWIDEIASRLAGLDVETVNAAVRKYLSTASYDAVFVTDDAAEVKAYLEADEPSPMEYNAAKPDAILEADKAIEKRKVEPTSVTIVPASEMFEGGSSE
ncbi:MAG: pitrilysin family protein [Thermoanaerobaculia bacterium]